MNSLSVLRSTTASRRSRRRTRRGLRRPELRGARGRAWTRRERSSFAAVLHSRRSFPVRLMNTVSSDGSATDTSVMSIVARSATANTCGTTRSAPRTWSTTWWSTRSDCVAPGHLAAEHLGEAVEVVGPGLDGDDGVGPGRRLQLVGRAECEQAPVVDDRQPVAELVGLLHVVGGEEDRLALAVELAEHLPQREAALRVEPGGRLVEEHGRGPVHDRPRHHQALGHAARQRGDRLRRRGRRGGTARAAASPRPSRCAAVIPKNRPWKYRFS